jgi:molybdate transport system ATP-binding protein
MAPSGGVARYSAPGADMTIEARFRHTIGGFALDADFAVPARGVTALFGPSGSGKTMLLRCIAGLLRAREGRFALRGEVWQDERRFVPAHRRALGVVFQEASLFPHLDVRGNLDYGRRRVAHGERRVSLEQVIELLGVGPLLARRVDALSGGERQRVAMARALAVSPQLLLMDEPLAALDAQAKATILPYLERLHEELTLPIVYVSHALDEVARLADHIVLMRDGRVLASGPLAQVLARPDWAVRLGEDAGVVLQARVGERDAQWHLARLDIAGGGTLWARDQGHGVGQHVRVRVLARDVSLAHTQLAGSSIVNQLPGSIEAIADDAHAAHALVRVRIGSAALLARVTRQSVHVLQLAPQQAVWAQVKSVALME